MTSKRYFIVLFLLCSARLCAQQHLVLRLDEQNKAHLGHVDTTGTFREIVNLEKINLLNGLVVTIPNAPPDLAIALYDQATNNRLDLRNPAIGTVKTDAQGVRLQYIYQDTVGGLKLVLKAARFPEPVELLKIGIQGKKEGSTSPAAGVPLSRADRESALGVQCNCSGTHDEAYIGKLMIDACKDCSNKNVLVYDADCKTLFTGKDGSYQRVTDLGKVTFRYQKEVKVVVVNVNRFLKDVKVTAEDLVYESEAPALFTNFFGSGSYATELLKSFGAQAGTELSAFSDALDLFRKKMARLNARFDRQYYLCCAPVWNCNDPALWDFETLREDIVDLNTTHRRLSEAIEGKLEKMKALEAEEKNITDQIKGLEEGKKPGKPEQEQLARLKQELAQNKTAQEPFKAEAGKKKQLDQLWQEAGIPDGDKLRQLLIYSANFTKQTYSYTTPSIFPQGNRMQLKLSIDSRDTAAVFKNGLMPVDHQELGIEGPVLGKWITSFSSGPFFAVGRHLYASRYEFSRAPSAGNIVTDSALYTVRSTGSSNPPIGLSAMAHFENKRNGWGWGGSIGVGLTVESKPRLAYLLGPSLFIGDKHQFAVTAGVCGMQVAQLKNGLYPDGMLFQSSADLQYENKFQVGGFVALSFTFFTLNNRNAAPAKAAGSE